MRIIVVAAKLELFFVTTPSSNTWWWDWGVSTLNYIKRKGNILWNQNQCPIERNNKVSTFYLWLFLWFTETWNDNDFTQQTAAVITGCLLTPAVFPPAWPLRLVTNETLSRYDRLLAHFLPGIGLISDLRQGGRRTIKLIRAERSDHNINNILQLELNIINFIFKSFIIIIKSS